MIIQEDSMDNLSHLFYQGKLDLAFLRTTYGYKSDYEEMTMGQELLCVCLNEKHPLAGKKALALSELKNENFLFYTKEGMLYQLALNLCQEKGFEPKISFASQNIESVLNSIRNNEGVSILMHQPGKSGELIYLPITPKIPSRLILVKQPDKSEKIVDTFWQYLFES